MSKKNHRLRRGPNKNCVNARRIRLIMALIYKRIKKY